MSNKSYEKGRNFEYRVAEKLRKAGFYVIRSAGSHGAFDLVAIKHGIAYGIQCKLNGYLSGYELAKLKDTATKYGIIACVAYKHGRKVAIKILASGKDLITGEAYD